MRTPRSRTTRASPATSLAGCTRAQSGSKWPATAPATRIRSATCAGGELAAEPLALRLGARDRQHPAAHDVGVDPLAGGDADDLVDGRSHCRAQPRHAVLARHVGVRPGAAGQLAGQPAAVAPRGPEAGEPGLERRGRRGWGRPRGGSGRSTGRSGRRRRRPRRRWRHRAAGPWARAGRPAATRRRRRRCAPRHHARTARPRRFDPPARRAVLLLVATPAASVLSGDGCRSDVIPAGVGSEPGRVRQKSWLHIRSSIEERVQRTRTGHSRAHVQPQAR